MVLLLDIALAPKIRRCNTILSLDRDFSIAAGLPRRLARQLKGAYLKDK
jgi:hypothetical protein